jgi:hypothetical protein
MDDRTTKDGYIRRVHHDSVIWYLNNDNEESVFVVARFPFVPDYHLCDFVDGHEDDPYDTCERPLQQFKTLTQALAVLRVIEGSQS